MEVSKLAEWAGFSKTIPKVPFNELSELERDLWESIWIYPDEVEVNLLHSSLPNFTESLDACFKWLVPKLDWVTLHLTPEKDGLWWSSVGVVNRHFNYRCKEPALALCLAIEKLIDST